ncbi:MAG: hypothetical protein ACPL1D_02420, partial [Microgenomates group bacterium]
DKLTNIRLWIIAFLINLMIFCKYTSIPFLVLVFIYLLTYQKKVIEELLKKFLILFFISLIFFSFNFGKDYFINTILIRQIINLKNINDIFVPISYYLLKNFPFLILNLLTANYLIKKKKYDKALIFLVPIFWLPNIFLTAAQGTYTYILYPVDIFIPLGFTYNIFLLVKQQLKFNLLNFFLIFWCFLVLFYLIQVINENYFLRSLNYDKEKVNQIEEIIIKRVSKNDLIIAPPYFLFLTSKINLSNLHDPFILYYYFSQKKFKYKNFDKLKDFLIKNNPKLIIADWRILALLELIDKNYLNDYEKIKTFSFINNYSEVLEIYLKK